MRQFRLCAIFVATLLALAAGCAPASPLPTPSQSVETATTPPARPTSSHSNKRTPTPPSPTLTSDDRRAVLNFTFDLFKQVSAEVGQSNTVLSPLSAGVALAMTANGARGETRDAMLRVLSGSSITSRDQLNAAYAALQSLLSRQEEGITLQVANSVWMRQGLDFNPAFQDRIQQIYAAELHTLNFDDPDAHTTINRWVSEKTQGRIPDILDRIPPEAVMYLLNAIYFKGAWADPFNASNTTDQPFFLANGSQKTVPLMYKRERMSYLQGDDFQAVQLFYQGGALRTTVILPRSDVSLEQWIAGLSADRWETWQAQFDAREGELHLPRFTVRGQYSLIPALSALGMGIAFTDQADFYDLLASEQMPPVRISDVRQRTFLEVNEEGAEAAAVTVVEMGPTSMLSPDETFVMRVDRPFLITIEDSQTGLPIFVGAIYDPDP